MDDARRPRRMYVHHMGAAAQEEAKRDPRGVISDLLQDVRRMAKENLELQQQLDEMYRSRQDLMDQHARQMDEIAEHLRQSLVARDDD